jgi:hypothetical protein
MCCPVLITGFNNKINALAKKNINNTSEAKNAFGRMYFPISVIKNTTNNSQHF